MLLYINVDKGNIRKAIAPNIVYDFRELKLVMETAPYITRISISFLPIET